MAIFTLRTEGADTQIEAETMEAARGRAREWIDEGDYDASGGTVYVDVHVIPHDQDGDEDRDSAERVTVAIHQPEPRCVGDDGHDWQSPYELVGGSQENPGIWAKNGMGVVTNEACMRCGCRRRTDTGAERHDTGERPFTEVTYAPGHYDLSDRREHG